MPASTNNEIILMGGRDIHHETPDIAKYLAAKASGVIGLVTWARDDHEEYTERVATLYAKYQCEVRRIESTKDLEGLSLVYYSGGNQLQLAKRLKETGLHLEVLNQWRTGNVIIAGSSAGAMVICGVMLGSDEDRYETGDVDLTHGLGPLGACFVVPHWSQWTTPDWREELISKHGEGYYIWGIDEQTALVWQAGHCKVIGPGKVYARGRMQGEWGDGQQFDVARGW